MADTEEIDAAAVAAARVAPASALPAATGAVRGMAFVGAEHRGLVALVALAVGCAVVLGASALMESGSFWAIFLFEKVEHSTFPFTIQNLINLIFFVGLGELFVRWRTARHESGLLEAGYLPEEESSVLTIDELGPIRREVGAVTEKEGGYLPTLIKLLAIQLQANRSVDQAVGVLTSRVSTFRRTGSSCATR